MIGSSIVSAPTRKMGATSLTDLLFPDTTTLYEAGDLATLVPPTGSEITCNHCNRIVLTYHRGYFVTTDRHDTQYHKTITPVSYFGLNLLDLSPQAQSQLSQLMDQFGEDQSATVTRCIERIWSSEMRTPQ